MKIKKEDIKRIISILESKYNELSDNEYFEFENTRLIKNSIILPEFWYIINTNEVGKIFDSILNTNTYSVNCKGSKLYSHNLEAEPLSSKTRKRSFSNSPFASKSVEITLEDLKQYQIKNC